MIRQTTHPPWRQMKNLPQKPISVYDVRQSWDLSGNLEDVIRRYILELSEDEVSNITEAMNRHIPEKKIKDCLTLPPEKLCLMLQFYMKQAN